MPRKVKTRWNASKKNPDEAHLKALIQQDTESRQDELADEEKHAQRSKESLDLLIQATGASERDLQGRIASSRKESEAAAKAAARKHAKPAVDFGKLHEQAVAQAKENDEKGEGRQPNPSWYGYIWSSSYGGYWSSWDGEAEEEPNATISSGAARFDPRAQAWGESWFDSDFSEIHAYLAFHFRSPSWGHLHIHTYPWLHGYYSLYSNDEWYNSEFAQARVDTWINVHQNFWRGRQYVQRFGLGGSELHPTRSGRIDSNYSQSYFTDVGSGDTVTIQVGARLYCRARAGGSHSVLNFQAGAANYVYVPYVYWYLHH